MFMLTRFFVALITSILLIYISTTILTFFGAQLQNYLIYIMWLVGLLLFYAFLPTQQLNFLSLLYPS